MKWKLLTVSFLVFIPALTNPKFLIKVQSQVSHDFPADWNLLILAMNWEIGHWILRKCQKSWEDLIEIYLKTRFKQRDILFCYDDETSSSMLYCSIFFCIFISSNYQFSFSNWNYFIFFLNYWILIIGKDNVKLCTYYTKPRIPFPNCILIMFHSTNSKY